MKIKKRSKRSSKRILKKEAASSWSLVAVVDRGVLEDAQIHPELYPDLIVRVAGYSAVFVNLGKDVQEELLSRTLYD